MRRSCERTPLIEAGQAQAPQTECGGYLFIAFITAPTIPVRIAPPPAPPMALPEATQRPAGSGIGTSSTSGRLPRSVPPATPPTAPLMILVNWLIATCCKTAPIA